MTDTPPHIKKMQLEIWLSKPPQERLRITLEDNDGLSALWKELRKNYRQANPDKPLIGDH